jgi:phenylalanyl-tRNA synthetase alpha chain
METHDPPVYVVVPGKVYRNEASDASHLPVFHQIEGLAVDERITFSDLKGTLAHFAREYLGPRTKVQLRPDFFPFTEPSAQLLVSCFNCDGGDPGCRVCGGSGWFEVLGCGMVDPNVLTAVGYDPGRLTGFAFGMGVERLAMVRHGITHIRHFVENDLRVLEQFRA